MKINSEEVSLAKDMDTLGVTQLLVEPKKKDFYSSLTLEAREGRVLGVSIIRIYIINTNSYVIYNLILVSRRYSHPHPAHPST